MYIYIYTYKFILVYVNSVYNHVYIYICQTHQTAPEAWLLVKSQSFMLRTFQDLVLYVNICIYTINIYPIHIYINISHTKTYPT